MTTATAKTAETAVEITLADALAADPYQIPEHDAVINHIRAGLITADQIREAFNRFLEGGVEAFLSKKTKVQLNQMLRNQYPQSDKKARFLRIVVGAYAREYMKPVETGMIPSFTRKTNH